MMGTRLLWGLLALQVALGATGVGVWRAIEGSGPPAPVPAVGGVPIAAPAGLEEGEEIARQRARAWRDGAELLSATMQVDWPWEVAQGPAGGLPPTGWATYVFVAPWEPGWGRWEEAASLTVLIDRLSGEVAAQSTLAWEEAPAPRQAPFAAPAVTSTAAALVAEAVGGTEFRRACPERRHLSRVSLLGPGTEGLPAHWLITYEDTANPGRHGLRLRIDATSAATLEMAQEAPGCGEVGTG